MSNCKKESGDLRRRRRGPSGGLLNVTASSTPPGVEVPSLYWAYCSLVVMFTYCQVSCSTLGGKNGPVLLF